MILDSLFKRPRVLPAPHPVPRIVLPAGIVSFVAMMLAKKGGVGKSTLAVNVGVAAACDGLRVLIIDTDLDEDQQNCVKWASRRQQANPKVIRCAIGKTRAAIAWGRKQGFELIIIDTAGRDLVHMSDLAEYADVLLTPGQASSNDLDATVPLRRLWSRTATPAAIVLNGVISEDSNRTRFYWKKFSELGAILPGVLVRRVEYIDAVARGQGVSEYRPGGPGDIEIRRLLLEVFQHAAEKRESAQ